MYAYIDKHVDVLKQSIKHNVLVSLQALRPSPISAPRTRGQRSTTTLHFRLHIKITTMSEITMTIYTFTYNIQLHLTRPYGTSVRFKTGNILTEHMNVSLRDGVETSTWQQDDMRFTVLRHCSCDGLWVFTYVLNVKAFCCVVGAQQKARFIRLRQSERHRELLTRT